MLYSKDNELEFELVVFANSKLSQLICKKLHLMKSKNTLMRASLSERLKRMFITVFKALRLIKAVVYCLMRVCFKNQRLQL